MQLPSLLPLFGCFLLVYFIILKSQTRSTVHMYVYTKCRIVSTMYNILDTTLVWRQLIGAQASLTIKFIERVQMFFLWNRLSIIYRVGIITHNYNSLVPRLHPAFQCWMLLKRSGSLGTWLQLYITYQSNNYHYLRWILISPNLSL